MCISNSHYNDSDTILYRSWRYSEDYRLVMSADYRYYYVPYNFTGSSLGDLLCVSD